MKKPYIVGISGGSCSGKSTLAYKPREKIAQRYLDTVRYRHDEFVEPTRWHADIVLNGTFGKCKGVPAVVAFIQSQMSAAL